MHLASLIVGIVVLLPLLGVSLAYSSRHGIRKQSASCAPEVAPAVAVRAFLLEYLSLVATLLAWPFGASPTPSSARGGETGIAVLLPDLGQHNGAFWLLRRRLSAAGWRSVMGPKHTRLANIDAILDDLGETVHRLGPFGATLVLIGHGTGGLVARAYLGRKAGKIRQIVTLATPHQGTLSPIARLPCLREIAPGSRLLDQLADDESSDATERVAICSDFDALIVPVDAAYDPGAFNIKVMGVGHFSMLTSRRTFELLRENLPQPPAHEGS